MSQYRLEVRVKPRPGLLDPQGKAVHHSLNSLGWDGVSDVRVDIDSKAVTVVGGTGSDIEAAIAAAGYEVAP